MAPPAEIHQPPGTEYRVRVDASVRHQEIANFSASDAWSMDPIGREWSESNRDKIADLLFDRNKGIGLSLWRFNVGAGSTVTDEAQIPDAWRRAECFKASMGAPYDWTRQAGQQWFLRAARRRGVDQFLAFAVSPPAWMTVNGHAQCDAQTSSTNLRPGCEGAFARFLVDVTEHFREQGIPFGYLSPVNEPEWPWKDCGQEGCRYSTQDIRRLTEALAAETLRTQNPCRIVAPDAGSYRSLMSDETYRAFTGGNDVFDGGNNRLNAGMYRCHVRELLGKPAGSRATDILSVHSYWCDQGGTDVDILTGIRRAVLKELDHAAGNHELWMTEYCVMKRGRDLGMDTAMRVARVLHADLVDAGASAWHWWLAVSPYDYKDGLIYTDYRTSGKQNVLVSKTLWVLGNYSRFVRPGARRIEATCVPEADGTCGRLLVSAYMHQHDRTLAIVLTNPGNETLYVRPEWKAGDSVGPLRLTPHCTSEACDLQTSVSRPFESVYALEPRSVTTLSGSWD